MKSFLAHNPVMVVFEKVSGLINTAYEKLN